MWSKQFEMKNIRLVEKYADSTNIYSNNFDVK